MSVGGQRRATILQVTDSQIKVDQWVAVFCQESEFEDPSIGKVKEVRDNQLRVGWYQGKWSGQWSEWMIPAPGPRRKQPWDQWVSKDAVLLYDFAMTATNRLKKETVTYLKQKYSELRQQ